MTEFGDKDDGITRRDFLDGVAITAAGLAAAAAAPHLTGAEALAASRGHAPSPLPRGYYPPTRTGLKGQRDELVRDIMRIDGPPNQRDVHSTKGGPGIHVRRVVDSDETYDCVIVGAGASGLAAAKYYRDRFGEDSRILLLDPLPGLRRALGPQRVPRRRRRRSSRTAARSTSTAVTSWNQTTGGLNDIPGSYGQPSVDLLEYLGVDRVQLPEHDGPGIPSTTGCARCCSSRRRDWGARHAASRTGRGRRPGRTGSPRRRTRRRRRAGIERIMEDRRGRPTGSRLKHGPKSDEEKKAILSRLTQKRYYMDYIGVAGAGDPSSTSATATRCSAPARRRSPPATCGRSAAPGFDGLGLDGRRRSRASAARRRWACRRARTTHRRRPGPTATRRCCGCSSTG